VLNFNASGSAPSSTQAVVAPALAYGMGTILEYLGTPDAWLPVVVGGVNGVVPWYHA
jgi:hypothetical protein